MVYVNVLSQISIIYCILSFNACTGVNQTIKQIHLVFRHGERSPSEVYSSDPHKSVWQNNLGSLTKKGKLQMYTLGQRIRTKYREYLPEYYFPEDIKVLSSYSDRCLMSAQLLTSGLFVPKNEQIWLSELPWQPIPISYNPRNKDNMIAAKQSCEKYDEIYKELFDTPKYRNVMKDNLKLFDYLTEHTGEVIDNLRKVEELFNTLEIEQLHNLTLPQWTNDVYPTKMKPLASLNLASFTETNFMKRMKGGTFVKKVLEDMRKSLLNVNAPKLFLYSGHDLTLVNILRTIGLSDEIKPNFAAYLIFEIHDLPQPEVKILYSNCGWCEEEELYISKDDSTLEHFEDKLRPVIPVNWEEECNV